MPGLVHDLVMGDVFVAALGNGQTAILGLDIVARTQTKDLVRQLLDELPDDCTIEDVEYRLSVVGAVQRGRAEIAAGRGIPHEQVKAELREKWAAGKVPGSGK